MTDEKLHLNFLRLSVECRCVACVRMQLQSDSFIDHLNYLFITILPLFLTLLW